MSGKRANASGKRANVSGKKEEVERECGEGVEKATLSATVYYKYSKPA